MSDKENVVPTESELNIIRELCTSNGIGYNQLENIGPAVKQLEMFFSGFPTMVGLNNFPNLTTLVIVGQSITKIENLSSCPDLKELWVCECNLKKIKNLDKNKRLIKLHLYKNKIRRIENIDHLAYLDHLDLSNNEICEIEGLSFLKCLTTLNIAGNRIKSIGTGLYKLNNLKSLNLSGNYLSSFNELTALTKLCQLSDLRLKDPLYHNNPVCLLCNYATYILFHFPNLKTLDSLDVTNSQLRELAVKTVEKKKIYYNMRMKTIHRNLTSINNRLLIELKSALELPKSKIKELTFALGSLEQQWENGDILDQLFMEKKTLDPQTQFGKDKYHFVTEIKEPPKILEESKAIKKQKEEEYNEKRRTLKERISAWDLQLKEIEKYYEETKKVLKTIADESKGRLLMELNTGGNVRFQVGTSADLWYTTCNDLMVSRFCAWDFKVFDISGLKLHGITRVHNRVVRSKFDNRVNEKVCDGSQMPNPKAYSKMIDYLFYVWNPDSCGKSRSPQEILEKGFSQSEMVNGAVPLTNSLFLSEKLRLESELIHQQKPVAFVRQARIIVSKVFLGKSTLLQPESKIASSRYAKMDSVYRSRRDFISDSHTGLTGDECECSVRQCEWFIFKPHFILPEYIIDLEYIFQKPVSPYRICIGQWLNTSVIYNASSLDMENNIKSVTEVMAASSGNSYEVERINGEERRADDAALALPPQVVQRPRIVTLTDNIMLKLGRASSLTKITELNLHGNGLLRLKGISAMISLRSLTVSFNELSRLDDIAHMASLEHVEASYNRINSLDGVRGMNKLKYLDIDWNQLVSVRDDLIILRKHAANIVELKLKNNPWTKSNDLYLRVVGRLKSLQRLDGEQVSDLDVMAASKLISAARLSSAILAMGSRTDSKKPSTLRLSSTAESLYLMSTLKPDPKESSWMKTVTVLNLSNQYVSKIGGVENLKSLRWACFSSNCISKLDGIDSCVQLEELFLQDNCIVKLEGLSKLTKLKKLDISSNFIISVESAGFENLQSLQYLAIEDNRIVSLKGLSFCTKLVELYIGNNRLWNLREIFTLKSLTSLTIVDMYGNSFSRQDDYRSFAIYHLHNLKALDGNLIESTEESAAKDMYGGRLSNDFVVERLNSTKFTDMKHLNFPSSSIRSVDISADAFKNLKSINLERNNLTSFSGLIGLPQLQVLCLNHNQIECILPRPRAPKPQIRSQYAMATEPEPKEKLLPVLESLEVLHLGYNKINHLSHLQLGRLINLKALFLQGNEITKLEGFEGLHELRELVLDRNKIKHIGERAFTSLYCLQELHLEENRIGDLSNLSCLGNLQRLFLGMNRIHEMSELEKLESISKLVEISVIGNAVARRLLHRPLLVFQQPNLQIIDGLAVTSEERNKADTYFLDQQSLLTDSVLPGITSPRHRAGSLKITNMPVGSSQISTLFPTTSSSAAQSNQFYEDERGVRRKKDRGTFKNTAIYNQVQSRSKLQPHNGSSPTTGFGRSLNYNHTIGRYGHL